MSYSNSPMAESVEDRFYRQSLIDSMTFELVPLKSVDAAIAALPPACNVSITCSPVKGIAATIELTNRVRALGHRVVPHIAARLVEGPEHVGAIADWLRNEGIDDLFLVGGDAETPAGPYHDASGFLHDLLAADPGLTRVGVPAYPDGHPLIDRSVTAAALHDKQRILAEAGISGYATTQMCFDPATIYSWLEAERDAGLRMPIHLGVAGVVDRSKLMTMGVRLGVGTSLRFLNKNRAAIGRLLTSRNYEPNRLLEPLSPALDAMGVHGIHCFTFNQVEATATWQSRSLSRR